MSERNKTPETPEASGIDAEAFIKHLLENVIRQKHKLDLPPAEES